MSNTNDEHLVMDDIEILFCEDDEQSRIRLASYLGRRVSKVHVVSNGKQALDLFLEHRPQIILTDIRMPEMNGIDLARAIRRYDPHVAIIFITAHNENDLLHASIDIGVSKYLVKPVNVTTLMDTIATIAKKIQQRRIEESKSNSIDAEKQYDQETTYRYVQTLIGKFQQADSSNIRRFNLPKFDISGDFFCESHHTNLQYIMLADGSGHGLSAVLPALQIPSLFEKCVKKGYSLLTIADELNSVLFEQHIVDHFLATTLIRIDHVANRIEVMNCGNPTALLIDEQGNIVHLFKSRSLALGAIGSAMATFDLDSVDYTGSVRLYVFTDGLPDTLKAADVTFDVKRINALFTKDESANTFSNVCNLLSQTVSEQQADDISLLEISLQPTTLLPVSKQPATNGTALVTAPLSNGHVDLKACSILIIEDDPLTNKSLMNILGRRFGMVYTAKDVHEGLILFQKYNPTIIITDLHLPMADALEMIQEMSRIDPSVPVIVISGASGYTNIEQLFEIGVKRFLRKPLDLKKLLEVIEEQVITQTKSNELHLTSSLFITSSLAISITNSKREIVAVNPAFCNITGYSQEEVLGRNPNLLSSGKHDLLFYQEMWQSLNTKQTWSGEIWNRRKNGELFLEWITINTILNQQGEVSHYFSVFTDITERKATQQAVNKLTLHDSLTDLPNRRLFLERLEQEIKNSERSRTSLALLFLDLDNFKDINDTLGHSAGDCLLQQVAHRLTSCVRKSDTVARLGGDEFTICLVDAGSLENIDDIANTILKQMAKPFMLGEEQCYTSVSIGITLYPNDASTVADLLKNADQAMYHSKTEGRNQAHFFTSSMQEAVLVRHETINNLRTALEAEDQFKIYYQPIVELATGNIHKAEALIRWQHPQKGLISPAAFIHIAEACGLICDIGNWVFQQAAQQAAIWKQTHNNNFQISINKSPRQFQNEVNSHQDWFEYLKELNLTAENIVIEITEGLLMGTDTKITEQLDYFHDAGIQISLDDFGTGYSSLSYLRKFKIDYLKIDQSFVKELTHNIEDQVLCKAIIVMAHSLGIKVIAEGIETESQRELLLEAGCDYGQGYLFSKPVPSNEFEALITKVP